VSNSDSLISIDGVILYPSATALRAAHSELLRRRRETDSTPDFLAAVDEFIRQGRATGALLDDDDVRWASQSLLNFWANTLYRAERIPPDTTLADFDVSLAPTLDDLLCPYRGLDAFQEANTTYFFGRQRQIEQLLDIVQHHRLVSVVGPSGSGKSSLVLAGLLPALRSGGLLGSQDWHYFRPLLPGSAPLLSLAQLILADRAGGDDQIGQYIERFRQEPEYLTTLISESYHAPIVLIVDQFEEVFTLCDDEQDRQAFIDNLLVLTQSSSLRHTVVLTMRSDFESFIARWPSLQQVFDQAQVRPQAPLASELREAIEKPAALVGLKIEAAVVDVLIRDMLGEPAGLPLLQFTLLKLWESRERNRVTWEAYERVGREQALAHSADAFYQQLVFEEQSTARRILLRIVRPDLWLESADIPMRGRAVGSLPLLLSIEVTSNRVRRQALYSGGEDRDRIDRVLNKLIQARLVRLTAGETPIDDQVEVAHEALVRNWPTLVQWIEEERADIAVRRQLEARAAEWVRLGQGVGPVC
jgi:hypothetical protein